MKLKKFKTSHVLLTLALSVSSFSTVLASDRSMFKDGSSEEEISIIVSPEDIATTNSAIAKKIGESQGSSITYSRQLKKRKVRSIKFNPRNTSLMDDSRFIAFVYAAKACTEIGEDNEYLNKSVNCGYVRKSVLMSSILILSKDSNRSISEIVDHMNLNAQIQNAIVDFLSLFEEAYKSSDTFNLAYLKMATAYLLKSSNLLSHQLQK